jgi:hypothetical protein
LQPLRYLTLLNIMLTIDNVAHENPFDHVVSKAWVSPRSIRDLNPGCRATYH